MEITKWTQKRNGVSSAQISNLQLFLPKVTRGLAVFARVMPVILLATIFLNTSCKAKGVALDGCASRNPSLSTYDSKDFCFNYPSSWTIKYEGPDKEFDHLVVLQALGVTDDDNGIAIRFRRASSNTCDVLHAKFQAAILPIGFIRHDPLYETSNSGQVITTLHHDAFRDQQLKVLESTLCAMQIGGHAALDVSLGSTSIEEPMFYAPRRIVMSTLMFKSAPQLARKWYGSGSSAGHWLQFFEDGRITTGSLGLRFQDEGSFETRDEHIVNNNVSGYLTVHWAHEYGTKSVREEICNYSLTHAALKLTWFV